MTSIAEPIKVGCLEDTPKVPDLVFRGFQGEADYANILKVISGSKDADKIERTDTLENIANYYTHLTNCDPYQDMIFAEVAGEVVGYSRVAWNLNDEGEWLAFHLGFLLPDYRRKGIGSAMLCFNEERLKHISLRLLDEGSLQFSTPTFYEAYSDEGEVGKAILLTRNNYEPVRYEFSMERSLGDPVEVSPMPVGLEVRSVMPEHYRAIWEASNEAFRDHWGHVEETEADFQRWQNEPTFNPNLWKVAWDGEQVAGMVLNFLDEAENEEYKRKRGYTEGISVRRPWRRRGLARALLTRSLKMFQDMGMTEAALGVDTQNLSGALRLYESVGFRPVKKLTIYRKQFSNDMIA
jgi:mycothiol synthase